MTSPQPTVWPALRYDDAPAALRFLIDVFGFRETLVVPGDSPDGPADIVHAELRWPDGGGVMFGSTKYCEGVHAAMSAGVSTVYVVAGTADQVDAVHARCLAAGARIASDLEDTEYGSHGFTALDPEGNQWTFGTYRGAP
jgi:uncharacterized glyoxalase superfamily protein PhnB